MYDVTVTKNKRKTSFSCANRQKLSIFALEIPFIMEQARTIANWIKQKPMHGRYTFTHEDVVNAFPEMASGTRSRALTREVSKGRIMSPLRGFYVVIPDEYALRGAVPQEMYIDSMMQYLGRNYYIALLNAGVYHGASHQAPMSFCVMIEPPTMREKITEKYHTLYFCKKHIAAEYIEKRQNRTGYVNVSGPELTAVDLLTYQERIGGLNRAATVLAELVEKLDFDKLDEKFVEMVPVSSLQRLGYILEVVLEAQNAADALYRLIRKSGVSLQIIPLRTQKANENHEVNRRWKIIENTTIEIDEL